MGKRILIASGSILMAISISLFFLDFISLSSILLYILSVITFLSSILAGKGMAYYIHDTKLAKERGMKISPSMIIYLWLLMFIIFLISYSIAKIALGLFIKIILFPLGGKYLPIIYNILSIIASYILFSGLVYGKKKFLTMWGKAAEFVEKAPKEMMKNGMGVIRSGEDVGKDMMKHFKMP